MRAVLAAALAAAAAGARAEELRPLMAPIAQRFVALNDSLLGAGRVKTVRVPGASWLKLSFDRATLRAGEGLRMRITSDQDGKYQLLDATTLAQWYYTSAYFNGESVTVTFDAGSVAVTGTLAGDPAEGGLSAICGSTDDRQPSNYNRAARYMGSGGCSGWLIHDTHHCFLTAGHCGTNGQGSGTMEFNVPLSSSSGSINHPGPEDQYSVDAESVQGTGSGVGNDWMYLGTFPNSNTGRTAYEAQQDAYRLTTTVGGRGDFTQIIGYGTTAPRNQYSQAQQIDDGELYSTSGSTARYRVDTTGGNSGSGVESEAGVAYAVHTHGGCGSSSTSSNAGTLLSNAGLQRALDAPAGICRTGPPPRRDDWAPLRRLIDSNPLLNNLAVTVGNASGRLFQHEKGDVTMRTEMSIASATKWISGVAIVSVVAEGKMALDDPAHKFLPYWTSDPNDRRSRITLRHMLAFNSGYTGGSSCGSRDFMDCVEHMYRTLECSHEPGTFFDYNSIHLHLAGGMAVMASGIGMADLIDQRVFEPAAMHESTWPNRANPGLSGSLRTTAEDYDRFLNHYFNGRLVPQQLRLDMETDQYPDASFGGYALFMGHYGFANWFECLIHLGFWRQECNTQSIHTSPGMNGYYPVTDRHLDYYFQIAFPGLPILGPAESAVMRLEIKPTIDAIMQGTEPPADALWPAEKRVKMVAEYAKRFAGIFNSSLMDNM